MLVTFPVMLIGMLPSLRAKKTICGETPLGLPLMQGIFRLLMVVGTCVLFVVLLASQN